MKLGMNRELVLVGIEIKPRLKAIFNEKFSSDIPFIFKKSDSRKLSKITASYDNHWFKIIRDDAEPQIVKLLP